MDSEHLSIRTFHSPASLVVELADFVTERLNRGVAEKKQASLVVSGGSTPRPLFQELANRDLNWQDITITLADERWVSPESPDSNEKLVRENLLQKKAAKAHFIGLKNSAQTAKDGEQICAEQLTAIKRPFDLVILGMGNDGHTASLFPGARQLKHALDRKTPMLCSAVSLDASPMERMTLTLPLLLDTRQVILHITGMEKRKILEQALADGSEYEMPVRAFLTQKSTPVIIFWSP